MIQRSCLPNGTVSDSSSKFDNKIEAASAKMYFHYYGKLLHQQNMLQDYVRTVLIMLQSWRIVQIFPGVLWLTWVQEVAGAKHVYAVEASKMANYACKLIAGNPLLAERITVIKGKIEDVELPEKADVLFSEPMVLINERMLETYVIARDRFLSPNGKMFPTVRRIHIAKHKKPTMVHKISWN
ncbi:probable histone-arginine methyltransferase 1.4 [Brassica rapa]|uniref:probable histone-arginine methyltransferase 1.4 n=1 Tax=Brassica campestris TaxID=3711 RepID=UPI00142E36C9|nr:probable histone-arginine methyltransferase 1.4 [Brassica rapa]